MPNLKPAAMAAVVIALLTINSPAQVEPVESDSASPVVINPPPPKTHLEAAAIQKGAMIIQAYSDIGNTAPGDDGSAVKVTAAEITNETTQAKEYGLIITVHQTHGTEREAKSYIDYDEIDSLVTALGSMIKLDRTVSQLGDFDARFRTRGDLEIANMNTGNGRQLAIRSVQIDSPNGQVIWATARHPLSRLTDFVQYLVNGKQAIDRLKAAK